jgi:uncharacterized protein YukE
MQVTPANVLHIRNALLAESQLLARQVSLARLHAEVGKPGQDPVSETAAGGFNDKIKSLVNQCQAYVDALATSAVELEQMAKTYGHTEKQISDSFSKFKTDHPAPMSLPTSPSAAGPPILSFAQSLATAGPSQPKPDLTSLFPGADGAHS